MSQFGEKCGDTVGTQENCCPALNLQGYSAGKQRNRGVQQRNVTLAGTGSQMLWAVDWAVSRVMVMPENRHTFSNCSWDMDLLPRAGSAIVTVLSETSRIATQ